MVVSVEKMVLVTSMADGWMMVNESWIVVIEVIVLVLSTDPVTVTIMVVVVVLYVIQRTK